MDDTKKRLLKSKIAFGTDKINDLETLVNSLRVALESAYPLIDSAKVYGNEVILGKAFKILKSEGYQIPLVQSKIWPLDFKEGAFKAVTSSLATLGLRAFDLYMIHRPHQQMSENVKIWKELIALQKRGFIKEIGVSNFDRDQIEILYNETKVYPLVNQIENSITYTRFDRIIYNQKKGIHLQGWRPFGRFALLKEAPLLKKLAQKYELKVPQLFIAYSASLGIMPIARSTISSEIEENIVSAQILLSKEDINLIACTLNSHETTTSMGIDNFATLTLEKSIA